MAVAPAALRPPRVTGRSYLVVAGLSESARNSPHRLPEFAMPCVAGWWPPGNVAVEIGDGTTRAACLSVPKNSIVGQQGGRWVELDLAQPDCVPNVLAPQIRAEQWQSAKAPQRSAAHPARRSDFPDHLRFASGAGASGMEMFVPRNSLSGLRTIACVVGADKCWATARDDLLLVKWPTARQCLVSGLEQDWSCVRDALEAVKTD